MIEILLKLRRKTNFEQIIFYLSINYTVVINLCDKYLHFKNCNLKYF